MGCCTPTKPCYRVKAQMTTCTNLPVRSSNTRMPRDQKSTLKLWPLLRMISGATYSGVPQKVHVFWPHLIFLAKPKSTLIDRVVWLTPERGIFILFLEKYFNEFENDH